MVLTSGLDVHDDKLFWVVVGWLPGAIGQIIDYGVWRVNSPISGSVTKDERTQQVEVAILEALIDFNKWQRETGWACKDTGEVKTVQLGLVDAGWKQGAVYEFCRRIVPATWRPSRGSANGVTGKYVTPRGKQGIRNVGQGHHESYQRADRVWLTWLDADK